MSRHRGIRLTSWLDAALEAEAQERGITISAVIRAALEEHLNTGTTPAHQPVDDMAELLARLDERVLSVQP